jgi:hypothetical protein
VNVSSYPQFAILELTYWLFVCFVSLNRFFSHVQQAIDDCMFRTLDIVDPENVHDGPILRLEHEVRSVVKKDGSMYKSCPFDEIPKGCSSNPSSS